MKRLGAALGLATLGSLLLVTGLALDGYLHAQDPSLAHREGLLTLTNPGHLLLIVGTVVTLGGLTLAILVLPVARVVRATAVGMIAFTSLGSAGVLAWSAGADARHHSAAVAGIAHDHLVAGDGPPGTAAAGLQTHVHGTADPSKATPGERAAAQLLLSQTRLSTQRYRDLAAATSAGYRVVTPPDQPIVHYVNPSFLAGGDTLDPERPESLIYGNSSRGPILLAAMYIVHGLGKSGPDIGGPLTLWHAHSNLCFNSRTGIIDAFTDGHGKCPEGDFNSGTPEMLHVWVVDNPDGPFSTDMNPRALVALLQGGAPPA